MTTKEVVYPAVPIFPQDDSRGIRSAHNPILKRFKEKSFAAGADREQILACEKELNIPLQEFVGIALKAMQGIATELGL